MKTSFEKILTIVIPTYNMEKYLHRCLDSIILEGEEQFKKLEVLVVNDGSKDSSSEIAHNYEKKYPSVIKVIDKENGNYGSCFNRGLKEASGKYIKLLDADDYYNTDELKKYLIELSETDADIVFSSFNIVDETGKVTSSMEIPTGIKGTSMYFNEYRLFDKLPKNLVAMHAIGIKRENLIKNGYFQQQGISYTDTEYSFFGLLYANTLYFSSSCLYQYYVGREGQTVSIDAQIKHTNDFLLILNRLLDELIENQNVIAVNKKEVLIYIISVLVHMYLLIAILAIPSRDIKTDTVKEILDKCNNCGIFISSLKKTVKYHGIPYLKLWHEWNISIHFIYKIISLMRRTK